MKNNILCLISILMIVTALATAAFSQSTEITYQGQLQNGSTAANGLYDFEFVLFDGVGTQVGQPLSRNGVTVTNGVFSAKLDFGSSFTGETRLLEIHVRQSGGGGFVTLSPRQPITSSPYAIKTLSADIATNAQQLGGIPASQYLQTNGSGAGLTGVVKSVNTVKGDVTIAGSGNITVATAGNTVTISATGGTGGVSGNGSPATVPLWTGTTNIANSMITQANSGVGIGTVPAVGVKLDVGGDAVVRTAGSGGNIQFGTPNFETGMTIAGTNRADVRFDGSALRLFTGVGTAPPQTGLLINTSGNAGTSGNFGVGTFNPDTRLTLNGGPAWTSNGWTASMNLRNGSAIGWDANASGQRFGIGQSSGGLFFFRSFSAFGTTASPASYDMVIHDDGNITQDRGKAGLVKAMIYVGANGVVGRCYNGIVLSSSSPCGFVVSHPSAGHYTVNFGFQVDDRFVIGNGYDNPSTGCLGTSFYILSTAGATSEILTSCGGPFEDAPFTLIVY